MSLEKPRFRRDLEARPVVIDGQSYVEVRDAAAGSTFLFYDFEYQVALAFDGLPLEKVIPWVKLATGLALQVDQLREFAVRLHELGFLEATFQDLAADHAQEVPDTLPSAPPQTPSAIDAAGEATVDGSARPDLAEGTNESSQSSAGASPEPPAAEAAVHEAAPADAAAGTPTDRVSEQESGPPDPDAVVMHPAEVVGETPPPEGKPVVVMPAAETDSEADTRPSPITQALAAAATEADVAGTQQGLGNDAAGEAGAEDAIEHGLAVHGEIGSEASVDLAGTSTVEVTAGQAGESESQLDSEQSDSALLGDENERIAEAIMQKAGPPDLEPSAADDSTAFPVLPRSRPATGEAQASVVPPPWATPRPIVTPGPITHGPSVDRPAARRRIRRSFILFGTLGVLAAAAVLAAALPFLFSSRQAAPVEVRTLAITPGTVYRYFDGGASIAPVPGPLLTFPAGGKVARIIEKGSAFAAGDVIAAVEQARGLLNQLTHQRERLAYYRQMAEAMHQVGNSKEEEREQAKVEARDAAVAKTLRELANVAVVANTAGEVDEALAREGQMVEAGSPALRLRSPGFRATFEFARAQAASARRLGFCQVEVEGYLLDCNAAAVAGDEARVAVDLPSVPPALVGKPAHLARARYSSAIVLPASALQSSGSRTAVFVVSGRRLEIRPVAVADRDDVEAIVVQGLDVGERVVVEPSVGLRAGMPVGTTRDR